MAAQQTESVLIGDSVSLYCDDKKIAGYVVAESPRRSRIVVQPMRQEDPGLGNIQVCTFRVLVQNKFKALRKFKIAIKARQHLMPHVEGIEDLVAQDQELARLQKLAQAEADDNQIEQTRQRGKELLYGQVVQLQHSFTNQFLKVSTSETATLDHSSMRCALDKDAVSECSFRILPRYRVRAEGEPVRQNDQVVLVSVRTSNYLHCSTRQFTSEFVEHGTHEVDVSVHKSAFVIHSFGLNPNLQPEGYLQAGDVIRLFHKEVEAYLCAEGRFGAPVLEDVHLRVRPDGKSKRTKLPTASSVFWQIELSENTIHGGPVNWEGLVRLRHMPTRQFLGVLPSGRGQYETCLIENHADANCVFRFHTDVLTDVAVHSDTFAHIQHVASGQWLSCSLSGEPYERLAYQSAAGNRDPLASLKWDGADLRQIRLSSTRVSSDAFVLTKVPEEQVDDFNFIAGLLPQISTFAMRRTRKQRLLAQETHHMIDNLKHVRAFQIVKGEPLKKRQKLLRHLGVIDLFLDVLKLMKPALKKGVASNEKNVSRDIYRVVQAYLEGNSRKNELFLARHISFFQSQVSDEVDCAAMLMELVRDNKKILDRLDEASILSFIRLLETEKDPMFLDFLSVLCICTGSAVPKNQDFVVKKLLQEYKDKRLVYLTDVVGSGSKREVMVTTDKGQSVELSKFVKSSDFKTMNARKAKKSTETTTETRRQKYLERQLALFGELCFDRNKFAISVITEELKYLTWEEAFLCLTNDALPASLREAYCNLIVNLFVDVDPNISDLDRINLTYDYYKLTDQPDTSAADDATLSTTGAKLEYFPQIRDWIKEFFSNNRSQTASLIDYNNFIAAVLRLTRYLLMFGYYSNIRDLKQILDPLTDMLDGRNDRPQPDISETDRRQWALHDRYLESPQCQAVTKAKCEALRVLELAFNFRFRERLGLFMYQFGKTRGPHILACASQSSSVASVGSPADDIKDLEQIFAQSSDWVDPRGSLVQVLLDLSLYVYDEPTTMALRVLNRFFSGYQEIFRYAVQGEVMIEKESIQVHERVQKILPKWRHLLSKDMTPSMIEEMMGQLKEFTAFCTLLGVAVPSADDDLEPHSINQTILWNASVFPDLVALLTKEVDLESDADAPMRTLLQQAFRFLRVFCLGNAQVQQTTFERLDLLLSVKVAHEEKALALAEVFTGNKELCLEISEEQVQKVAETLANHQAPSLLAMLGAIVKVEEINLPLKRNQNFVMKFLSLYRERIIKLVRPEENPQRLALLRGGDCEDLEYHLELVDLLATLAEGENRFIESVCQTIFSVKGILEVLCDESIPIDRRLPYLRFFIWVYLNTASSAVDSGVALIDMDSQLWQFMYYLYTHLYGILGTLDKNSGKIGEQLSTDDKELFFDGVLPFLTVFYGTYYKPSRATDNTVKLSQSLAETLVVYAELGHSIAKDRDQYNGILGAVMTVNGKAKLQQDSLDRLAASVDPTSISSEILSPARKEYLTKFGLQIDLNLILNRWVEEVRDEYFKQDGIEHQEEDDEGENFDYDLPHGQEFQDHMKVFLDFQARGVSYVSGKPQPIQGLNQFAEKLVDQLNISMKLRRTQMTELERTTMHDLNIKTLQILRGILYHEKSRWPQDLSRDDNPRLYDDVWANVAMLQNEFNKHGAAITMINLFASPDGEETTQAMKFLISMLEGDNRDVQRTFENYFLNTREELFFVEAQERIEEAIQSVKERRVLLSQFTRASEKKKEMVTTLLKSTTQGGSKMLLDAANAETEEDLDLMLPEEDSNDVDIDFSFTDKAGSKLVLRIMESICGGENRVCQNYLRVQEDNAINVNVITETVRYLHALYLGVDKNIIVLIIELLTTINEVCLGNHVNQGLLFDEKIIDPINHFLRQQDFPPDCSLAAVARLKHETVLLILSLLEYNSIETEAMAKELHSSLDLKAIHVTLNRYFFEHEAREKAIDRGFPVADYEPEDVGLACYTLLARLGDFSGDELSPENVFAEKIRAQRQQEEKEKLLALEKGHVDDEEEEEEGEEVLDLEEEKYWRYNEFKEMTGSVEFIRDDTLQIMRFPIRNKDALRDTTKAEVLWNIDRFHGPVDKVRDFYLRSLLIIKDLKNQTALLKKPHTRFLVKNATLWKKLIVWLTLIINTLMLATYSADVNFETMRPVRDSWVDGVLYALGACHLLISLALVSEYLLTGTRKAKHQQERIGQPTILDRVSDVVSDWIPTGRTVYHIAFLVASIAGLIYNGYFFAFHLLHFALDNDVLARVFKAITSSASQLLWVTLLALVIIYIYALVAFAYLRQSFRDENGMFCDNMGQCFMSVVSNGLRAGGGLGDVLPPFTFSWSDVAWRVAFDLSFWVLITIVGLNIVFTVIVGTFARLREERSQITEDMRKVCLVCSLQSYDFDRLAKGFAHHIKREHNVWNYLWLMIYLEEKDIRTYTSHEAYLKSCLDQGDLSFFPLNRALSLNNVGKDETLERLTVLEDIVNDMVTTMKKQEQEKILQEERERAEQHLTGMANVRSDAR